MSQFHWECHPDIERLLEATYLDALEKNSVFASVAKKIEASTSTHICQWVEAIFFPYEEKRTWYDLGFVTVAHQGGHDICANPKGMFPLIVFTEHSHQKKLSLAVEDVSLFCCLHGFDARLEGSPMSSKRSAVIASSHDWVFEVSERRGGFLPTPEYLSQEEVVQRLLWKDALRMRRRSGFGVSEEALLYDLAHNLAQKIVDSIGQPIAASLFLEVEREVWQSKNRAGQFQYARQNSMGLGWANHDHHTFRSSRAHFQRAVRLFEILGFRCRERFLAGKEAGWGAQVFEHPTARGVLFLDVDLAEDEVKDDFSHAPLKELDHLGTIGLWCGLHGESLLNAGMHHLEAQFDFNRLQHDLLEQGVTMMPPFSSFSYLHQAFTTGERWRVDPRRVEALIEKRYISKEIGEKFLRDGAIGSHLENLERREGYKGFNQHNVSSIIRDTDPRIYL